MRFSSETKLIKLSISKLFSIEISSVCVCVCHLRIYDGCCVLTNAEALWQCLFYIPSYLTQTSIHACVFRSHRRDERKKTDHKKQHWLAIEKIYVKRGDPCRWLETCLQFFFVLCFVFHWRLFREIFFLDSKSLTLYFMQMNPEK